MSKIKSEIEQTIASAIKAADDSYFFENYTKQAVAVLNALRRKGYKIAPIEATPEMVKEGVKAISLGSVDARDLAKYVYKQMLDTPTK